MLCIANAIYLGGYAGEKNSSMIMQIDLIPVIAYWSSCYLMNYPIAHDNDKNNHNHSSK